MAYLCRRDDIVAEILSGFFDRYDLTEIYGPEQLSDVRAILATLVNDRLTQALEREEVEYTIGLQKLATSHELINALRWRMDSLMPSKDRMRVREIGRIVKALKGGEDVYFLCASGNNDIFQGIYGHLPFKLDSIALGFNQIINDDLLEEGELAPPENPSVIDIVGAWFTHACPPQADDEAWLAALAMRGIHKTTDGWRVEGGLIRLAVGAIEWYCTIPDCLTHVWLNVPLTEGVDYETVVTTDRYSIRHILTSRAVPDFLGGGATPNLCRYHFVRVSDGFPVMKFAHLSEVGHVKNVQIDGSEDESLLEHLLMLFDILAERGQAVNPNIVPVTSFLENSDQIPVVVYQDGRHAVRNLGDLESFVSSVFSCRVSDTSIRLPKRLEMANLEIEKDIPVHALPLELRVKGLNISPEPTRENLNFFKAIYERLSNGSWTTDTIRFGSYRIAHLRGVDFPLTPASMRKLVAIYMSNRKEVRIPALLGIAMEHDATLFDVAMEAFAEYVLSKDFNDDNFFLNLEMWVATKFKRRLQRLWSNRTVAWSLNKLMVPDWDDDDDPMPTPAEKKARNIDPFIGFCTPDVAPGGEVLVLDGYQEIGDRELKETLKTFSVLAEKPLPLTPCPSYAAVREALDREFPWATELNDQATELMALAASVGMRHFWVPPMLLKGPPGLGKTRWARKLAEFAGGKAECIPSGGDRDSVGGSSPGWRGSRPSAAAHAFLRHKVGNPLIIVDEIDKTIGHVDHGSAQDALLPYLEDSAMAVEDPFMRGKLDARWISWVLTANDMSMISAPLLSRCRIFEMPPPRPQDFGALVDNIRKDTAQRFGCDASALPELPVASRRRLENRFAAELNPRALKADAVSALSKAAVGREWFPEASDAGKFKIGFV